jgi:hypothetical protein
MHIQEKSINNTSTLLLNGFCTNTLFSCEPSTKNTIGNNIVLEMEWIPRDDNSYVDYLSKLFDFDDWSVCKNVFDYFNLLWGPYTCDRFADNNNRKSYFI